MVVLGGGVAAAAGGQHQVPYAGQEARAIKSLSPEDVAALRAGQGWGLAKPAELNGYPGPLHVLALGKELDLNNEQRERIQEIFDRMKASAEKLGADYLAAEQALDAAFAERSATHETIAKLVSTTAAARGKLQNVHLQAHLETAPLLSEKQRLRYNALRGYSGGHILHHGATRHHKGSHSGN
jgi:Spy/CpxP family protein refolding chaperone